MPKNAMDYSKCVIYKIVCNDLSVTDCYVGHTTNFIQRKKDHKKSCNKNIYKSHNLKVYKTIRGNGGWENWSMFEIEKYPCKDNNEACARERLWYETLKSNLNLQVPNRSIKEWNEDNKEYVLKKQKIYNIEKKVKIAEKAKEKYVCDCGSICRIFDKSRHFRTKKHSDFISASNKDAETVTENKEIEPI
jgi:hypothetical protein